MSSGGTLSRLGYRTLTIAITIAAIATATTMTAAIVSLRSDGSVFTDFCDGGASRFGRAAGAGEGAASVEASAIAPFETGTFGSDGDTNRWNTSTAFPVALIETNARSISL